VKTLRVLEAITPSRIGGAEVYVASLCEELPRRGAEVVLFCPKGRPFADYAARRGLRCVCWPTCGKLDPVTLLKLVGLIKRERIGVVHTHLSTASLLGAFAARLAGVHSVAHVHGLNSAACFRYSSLVIAVSEAVKRHLCAQGLNEGRIRVIHNGVDLERFRPAPASDAKVALGRDPKHPLVGVFGRLSPEKGQRIALEAMFLLLKDRPGARLLLVGDGPDRAELLECARALGIERVVEFAGFRPDTVSLLSACDVVLVPSAKEGFGLVAVEAMAAGKPVVATRVGGLSEIVVHGETGFLVRPNDPNSIARSLAELIDDSSLCERMGRQGRERAEACFDFRAQAACVADILSETATSGTGSSAGSGSALRCSP
jgi:glycosyltransferase involved in cell wall biosynthesis